MVSPTLSPSPPWRVETGIDSVLARWLASAWVRPCICADETTRAATGAYEPLPLELAPGLNSPPAWHEPSASEASPSSTPIRRAR
jgi:hypothetical protein